VIAAALVAALADLCVAPPAPAVAPDRDDAAAYIAVGDEARDAGDARTAAIAYRKALALDPNNPRALAAWRDACTRVDTSATDRSALADAIARYDTGDIDGARAQLVPLAAGSGVAADGAHFYLALAALADHDRGGALAELALARRDPAYEPAARALARVARRDGTIAALVLVAPEYDTNPALLPDTPPPGATSGSPRPDFDLLVAGRVTVRPRPWLYLRDVFAWRAQAVENALTFLSNTAQLGVELRRARWRLAAAYDFGYDALDGDPYLFAHRGAIEARREAAGSALVASASLRRRDYRQSAQAGFTGWVATVDAGAIIHATPRFDIDARAVFAREETADPTFSDVAIGADVAARARIGARTRIVARALGWYARYDAAEPDGTERRDGHGEASADVEIDLADHLLATCGGAAIGNTSTVPDFVYAKYVARCGLAAVWGGP
jgi:hypothetical protein